MTRTITSISAISLFAALAALAQPAAQEDKPQPPRYTVTDLGTPGLGGPNSTAFGINNGSRVGGYATDTSGIQHAVLWDDGHLIDAGTPGLNSQASGPNRSGKLAILTEIHKNDPLDENFCFFGTGRICIGAVWKNGVLTPLPTLGGNNAIALALNSRGQVTGFAETGTADSTCKAPQRLQVEAVIWGPKEGQIRKLSPLSGDTVGFALGINNRGEAAGSSGTCANTPLFPMPFGPHAVLWQKNGSPINLGTLGGKLNTAAAINNRGEVVGGANLPGDTALHTFLWTKDTGMQDLSTVGTDNSSFATWINNEGQVVGASCDSTLIVCRAYLWQSDIGMRDLNSLIPANSSLYLAVAFGINDGGEIVGLGVNSSGEIHAFLATPNDDEVDGESFSPAAQRVTIPMALPENARKSMRWPLGTAGR